MATTNKSRYALLGVLCIKPCTGYDIKKFCDKTISHFWNENFGHIYPVLKQLEEEGLVEGENASAQDRRRLYHITDTGREVFYDWLIQNVEVTPPRSELLLKLSFGNYMPKDKVIEMLQELKGRFGRNLLQYRENERSFQSNEAAKLDRAFPYWLSSLRYGIVVAEATLTWCEDTILLLQQYMDRTEEEACHEF